MSDTVERPKLIAVAQWATSSILKTLHGKSDTTGISTLTDDELVELIGAAGRITDAAMKAGIGYGSTLDIAMVDGLIGTARARRRS